MDTPLHIAARRINHTYRVGRRKLQALSEVDLQVARGEFVSIIGPSGAGKTTLLKLLGGLLEPTSGSVTVAGESPSNAQRRKDIGFVFQEPSLLPWRTARENIVLPLEMNRHGSHSDFVHKVDRWLQAVNLEGYDALYPHQLSGGMKQRVAFARALIIEPTLLLMDEPLGSLDEITRSAMRYELLKLWENSGKTVVMVTHSILEAVALSDRVVVMSARPGRVFNEVKIELPRPREESLEFSVDYTDHALRIKEILSEGAPHKSTSRNPA